MANRDTRHLWLRLGGGLTTLALVGAALMTATSSASGEDVSDGSHGALRDVVPAPVSVQPRSDVSYAITARTAIYVAPGSAEAAAIGGLLADLLRPSTGYRLPVTQAREDRESEGISLLLSEAGESLGDQGYRLDVTAEGVTVRAEAPAGLFAGVQTLRQLLPARVESRSPQRGPWTVPGGRIVDYPRFAYRGAMLDVARHFFPVAVVKRYIDEISLYKVNYLHLHLSDDQGWRIAIRSWPNLATYGGSTQVGGGPGGYYTQDDYSEIVAYAQAHYVTIVPEIDMPGHTNAALASYAALNCNGQAPPLYTGIRVGFSSLCIGKEVTTRFVTDVLGELAALTPGPYLHVGGDEAHSTPHSDYSTFENQVFPIVDKLGKTVMGWHDITNASPTPPTSAVPQFWGTSTSNANTAAAAARGNKIVLSPANKAYLDQKYDANTPLGLHWAGYIEVRDAYDWNPGSYLTGVGESSVLGVEAPLWSETLTTMSDIEYMAFPRLPAIAELGWSPASTHDWNAFTSRLAAQGARWSALGIHFYRSPQVPWASDVDVALARGLG